MKKAKINNDDSFILRPYKTMDFPRIKEMIQISFDEFTLELPEDKREFVHKMTKQLFENGDMSNTTKFEEKFIETKAAGQKTFIVILDKNDVTETPIACVGGIQINPYDFELMRLFVDNKYRGKGLGKLLVDKILDFAKENGYERVVLSCGSKSGQATYRKMQFHCHSIYQFWKKVSKRTISNVCIIGGVHGNELIGIHLLQQVWNKDYLNKNFGVNVTTLLANEKAAKKNIRFIDRDLNRCFALDELNNPDLNDTNIESIRAREINSIIGPKCEIYNSISHWRKENPNSCDYLIDLHSTTSNMGISLITLAGDKFTIALANHLKNYFDSLPDLPPFNLMVDSECKRSVNNNIDSITPSGICFEVGPLAHGTLNNKSLLDGTKLAMEETLRFIESFNKREFIEKDSKDCDAVISGYSLWKPVYYPKQQDSLTVSSLLHPDLVGKDFQKISKGIPIFVDLISGELQFYEEEDDAYPCFIGEAAYFSSGIAMWLCKKSNFNVYLDD